MVEHERTDKIDYFLDLVISKVEDYYNDDEDYVLLFTRPVHLMKKRRELTNLRNHINVLTTLVNYEIYHEVIPCSVVKTYQRLLGYLDTVEQRLDKDLQRIISKT